MRPYKNSEYYIFKPKSHTVEYLYSEPFWSFQFLFTAVMEWGDGFEFLNVRWEKYNDDSDRNIMQLIYSEGFETQFLGS